jgi:hypothetical protein
MPQNSTYRHARNFFRKLVGQKYSKSNHSNSFITARSNSRRSKSIKHKKRSTASFHTAKTHEAVNVRRMIANLDKKKQSKR